MIFKQLLLLFLILTFHWMCLSLSFFHLFTFSSISTLIVKERAAGANLRKPFLKRQYIALLQSSDQ